MSAAPDIEAQIACVARELSMRRKVYPGRVARGTATEAGAKREIEVMEAVLATLQSLRLPPAQGSLLP